MNKIQPQVTVIEFCMHLSEKYMAGRAFAQIDFEAINNRIERQNLTVIEERRVHAYVSLQRAERLRVEAEEKAAEARAAGKVLRGNMRWGFINAAA